MNAAVIGHILARNLLIHRKRNTLKVLWHEVFQFKLIDTFAGVANYVLWHSEKKLTYTFRLDVSVH